MAKIRLKRAGWIVAAGVVGIVALWLLGVFGRFGYAGPFFYTKEAEQSESAKTLSALFQDDYNLAEKNPQFDPALVDSRLYGDDPANMWQINASAAVMRLDVQKTEGWSDRRLVNLYATYAEAARKISQRGKTILPSLDLISGKAKQFDDGLYAELDSAFTAYKMKGLHDTSEFIKALLAKLDPNSAAYAWVWGGLKVGEFLSESQAKNPPAGAQGFIAAFDQDEVESKPSGFYTWSPDLKRTFRFLRYFQKAWNERDGVPDQIAAVLASNADLMSQYDRLLDFYAHVTNPFDSLSFKPLTDPRNRDKTIRQIWEENKGQSRLSGPESARFLPYSSSKEVALFNRLFPSGLSPYADLMMELVKAIRSGEVDLAPHDNSGWYDYQVYALETFLLPKKGKEYEKLLLSKSYKERMLQAFQVALVKRRETHLRQLSHATAAPSPRPPRTGLPPRLRVEPNPTFYIRMARAYAFLQTYLESVIPDDIWKNLRGQRQGGQRDKPLREELEWTKNLFYGFHLISCEDIGMRPVLLDGELPDPTSCKDTATQWLSNWLSDPDLAVDTRVSVPIYVDELQRRTRIWATLGVRGMKLNASYFRPPMWRSAGNPGAIWLTATTVAKDYLILTEEFAEFQLGGLRTLTREELRKVCDRNKTKERIIRALSAL